MRGKLSIFHYLLCSSLLVSVLLADTNTTSDTNELGWGGGLQLKPMSLVQ